MKRIVVLLAEADLKLDTPAAKVASGTSIIYPR
jgi:hypothetical protein